MVQLVGDNGILLPEQGFEYTAVSVETSRVKNSVFGSEEFGDFGFQFLVNILEFPQIKRTDDIPYP